MWGFQRRTVPSGRKRGRRDMKSADFENHMAWKKKQKENKISIPRKEGEGGKK